MKTENILLEISETGANTLRERPSTFNVIRESFATIEGVKEYLRDRYGKVPTGKNKVYIDDAKGNSFQVGFTYSFWNKDISHNSKNWRQTDWISLYKQQSTPIIEQLFN